MAAGRENNLVSSYYMEDHPAVLKLIGLIVKDASGCRIEICGELASNTEVLSKMIKLGIKDLSVSPSFVPEIKEAVRKVEL
jgi:phosphotransferase system enzyme I (PtsI)